jgi:Na+/H+ antiporter NhaA
MGVGLVLTQWPLLLNHPQPWPLMEGVKTSMLVALSLLSFLGLRYPLKMVPILLFELGWKAIWVAVVVLPLWRADQLDAATLQVFYSCLVVLIVAAVVPWRHVVSQYLSQQGDPWRPGATPASEGQLS